VNNKDPDDVIIRALSSHEYLTYGNLIKAAQAIHSFSKQTITDHLQDLVKRRYVSKKPVKGKQFIRYSLRISNTVIHKNTIKLLEDEINFAKNSHKELIKFHKSYKKRFHQGAKLGKASVEDRVIIFSKTSSLISYIIDRSKWFLLIKSEPLIPSKMKKHLEDLEKQYSKTVSDVLNLIFQTDQIMCRQLILNITEKLNRTSSLKVKPKI